MNENLVPHLEDFYLQRLEHGRTNAEKLGWESSLAHQARFRTLATLVDCNCRSLLDVGCGLGDLYRYFLDEGIACRYTGIDILPHMIHRACTVFPTADFRCVDVIGQPELVAGDYDIVYAAGVFNLRSYSGPGFLQRAYTAFTRIATQTIVISLLHCRAPAPEPDTYCYFDPLEVQGLLTRPDWGVEIHEGYLANDFTVVARRKAD